MRNQTLTGFALHQRRYRERSYILHFFSAELGRVDGVIRQMPPALYHFSALQATGKTELKSFSQLDVQGQPFYLQQKALFAGFYLNELLFRLLPVEEAMPETYRAYVIALEQLKHLAVNDEHDVQLKLILRQFEYIFLNELGYTLDFEQDHFGQPIQADRYYDFVAQDGFVPQSQMRGILGQQLRQLAQDLSQDDHNLHIHRGNMTLLGKLYRSLLSDLLGNKPLKSRQLWLSQQSS